MFILFWPDHAHTCFKQFELIQFCSHVLCGVQQSPALASWSRLPQVLVTRVLQVGTGMYTVGPGANEVPVPITFFYWNISLVPVPTMCWYDNIY